MKLVRIFGWVLAVMISANSTAQAALTIEITQGVEGALPVAVVPFLWQGEMGEAPLDVAAVIGSDLGRSGRFSVLPRRDMLAKPNQADQIRYQNWRLLNVESLVIGTVREAGASYIVQFQLFDVFRGTQVIGYSIRSSASGMRRTAHQISDLIYEALQGEPGVFATRIAYVTELRATDGSRRYSIQVADADGYNPKPVLNSRRPLMSPSWSPDGRKLAYVSFETGRPAIYIQEIDSGEREKIASFKGVNGAPVWSPDGKRLALVLSKSGSLDIYILDLGSKKLERITRSYAIDTEPVWSPDSSALVFTSDRGGRPQLYRVDLAGRQIKRLTFEGKYNARATFSPDGRSLAFVHAENNLFRIALMDLQTGAIQVLTDTGLDESPSFAPNGSMIIYATESQSGKGVLSAVSVDGRVRQRLALQIGDAREPAWAPHKK